jgi:hypothetical protein
MSAEALEFGLFSNKSDVWLAMILNDFKLTFNVKL